MFTSTIWSSYTFSTHRCLSKSKICSIWRKSLTDICFWALSCQKSFCQTPRKIGLFTNASYVVGQHKIGGIIFRVTVVFTPNLQVITTEQNLLSEVLQWRGLYPMPHNINKQYSKLNSINSHMCKHRYREFSYLWMRHFPSFRLTKIIVVTDFLDRLWATLDIQMAQCW